MALVEITAVRQHEPDLDRLHGFAIDAPVAGSEGDVSTVVINGWVLGQRSPAIAVEVAHLGTVLRWAGIDLLREDVAAVFPSVFEAEISGFTTSVDVVKLAPSFELVVRAVLKDATRVPLGTITGRHRGWRRTALGSGVEHDGEDTGTAPREPRRRVGCSVIIPVHNKASLTRQCLNTLLGQRHEFVDLEIIVVDDASTDLTGRLLIDYANRGVRGVSHPTNLGFSMSCNDGANAATGEYLLFLNNDTIPQPGWLDALVGYAEDHPEAAAVGSKLLFPNETVQHCGVVIGQDRWPRHLYAGFPGDHPAVNTSRRFQIVTAACALFRRGVFEAANGFDTAFINGWEDVDLCLRLGETGHEIHYCHESVLYHLESVSRDVKSPFEKHNNKLYASRWLEKVQPDDLRYYVDDGLLNVTYSYAYPLRFSASPLLALVGGSDRDRQSDRLLNARAWQVLNLLKHNIHLNVRLQEAELRGAVGNGTGPGLGNGSNGVPALPPLPALAEPRVVAEGVVHELSSEPSGRVISVILLVDDDTAVLRELMPRVLRQQSRDGVEFVAFMQGAADAAVDVLGEFRATVVAVDPRSFNLRTTRNLAAVHAKGEVLVFLDPHARPADDQWLANLVAPLAGEEGVAVVCGRVLPREDADPLTYRDGISDLNAAAERRVQAAANAEGGGLAPEEPERPLLFHLRGTAMRSDVLAEFPFPSLVTAADELRWARATIAAGHAIQYEPSAVVRCSPAAGELVALQRGFDQAVAARSSDVGAMAADEIVPRIAASVREDWRYLDQTSWLEQNDLDEWRIRSVIRRTAEVLGRWLGQNAESAADGLASRPPAAGGATLGAVESIPEITATTTSSRFT